MNIIVLIKQVPGTNKVDIDPETGSLIRTNVESKINPYDLYALEAAVRLKERTNGRVTALTMGPPQAQSILQEAFMMGVDAGYLLTDRRFAGADTLATSRALAGAIQTIGLPDLIITGRQTTDGDTAQVGPQIAEMLHWPHAAWVSDIGDVTSDAITVTQDFTERLLTVSLRLPCLITVEKDIMVPRLPSYKRKLSDVAFESVTLTFDDLPDRDESLYGLKGSPTQVDRIFPPKVNTDRVLWHGSADELAAKAVAVLREGRLL